MTFSQRAVEAAAKAIRILRNGSREGQAKAALSAALAVDGLCLVPRGPSEREINAAIAALGSDDDRSSTQIVMDVRAAMLSAASEGEERK